MVGVIVWVVTGWMFLIFHYAMSSKTVLSNSMDTDDRFRIIFASVLGPFYALWALVEEML